MYTLLIRNMSRYVQVLEAQKSAACIIQVKVDRQHALLNRYTHEKIHPTHPFTHSISEVLLYEARRAKVYWRVYRTLVPTWTGFESRKPHHPDVVNQLLDIGYHHLKGKVKKILDAHGVFPGLALIHVAKTEKSVPLVYDLIELFRADIVDREVLRFFRFKKRPISALSEHDIRIFLGRINTRCAQRVYVKVFHQCHTYAYYMELQVLMFIKAVNHGEVFSPIHLSVRHENRCTTSTGTRSN